MVIQTRCQSNLDLGPNRCALGWAARAEDPDWLRIMLAQKANPSLTYKSSIGATETPLMATVLQRRLTNLKMLIAAGADVNYRQPGDGHATAAIMTAFFGWFEGTYALLEAGGRLPAARLEELILHTWWPDVTLSNDLKESISGKSPYNCSVRAACGC